MDGQLYIGLMSGTSMDGVDAVLVRMRQGQWLGAQAHAFLPYPQDLRTRLLDLQQSGTDELHRSAVLAQELSRLYAEVVAKLLAQCGLPAQAIAALGCHGQTVRHAPEHGYSIQLADLPLLAELSGIFTVGDFRSRDLAAGGQGAPLVPAFHQALFADADETRVVLNIGGIANISVLPPQQDAYGFDTGSGNMLMDAWTQHIWGLPYDADGAKAAQGQVLPELLARLCAHPYFRLPPPKSTGRELFSLAWLQSHLNGAENPHDVLRTLLAFTAQTIVEAVLQTPEVRHVYACGGGVFNRLLMSELQQRFAIHSIALQQTDVLNLNPQWVEAAAFAWLAACWQHALPGNPHRATGAHRPLVLGAGHYA